MSAFIDQELRLFFRTFMFGIMLAASYDLLKIIRNLFKHKKWLIDGEDILFWLFWFFAMVDFLYYGYHGIMRGYIMLAVLSGIGIYEKTGSPLVVRFAVLFIRKMIVIIKIPLFKVLFLLKKLTVCIKKVTIQCRSISKKRGKKHGKSKKGSIS